MSTPLVRIKLGDIWEEHPGLTHEKGSVVRKDARRGKWLLENIPGSAPADRGSAVNLGVTWPLETPKDDDEGPFPNARRRRSLAREAEPAAEETPAAEPELAADPIEEEPG